jgi:UDP-GlcNAc:undecaprenyl-phosphate GlcNAc-1-phosphate transferase
MSISSIYVPQWIAVISGLFIAFAITCLAIPSIVYISRIKGLCAIPNGRTSHSNDTPTLGGIAIFAGIVISTVIFAGTYFKSELQYILAGLVIVFFMGIKDDVLIIDPWKKLAGQIFAALIITVFAGIRINNLYGLFEIGNLPYIVSILISVLVFVIIVNGFNLVDGIDGLASGTGILTSSVFGIWFWMTGNIDYTVFSFAFAGSLSAFFIFNVFGKRNKIFLGDSGSMITGLVLGVLVCSFLQHNLITEGALYIQSSPAVAFGILIVPLFDTLRVFTLRIVQGKSPFTPDRQHIHHRLIQLGNTHLQATLILLSFNLLFIALCYLLQGIGIIWLMCVNLGLASLMSYILMFLVRGKVKQTSETEKAFEKIRARMGRRTGISVLEKEPIKIPLAFPSKINAD